MAPDKIQTPRQHLVALAYTDGDVYPLKELLATACGDGFSFVVRAYALDGQDHDETEPTTCPRMAAMLWLQASGAEIEIVVRES